MPLIEAKNVKKIYGRRENEFAALDDVSLKIEKGESIAILGKSGSGKSTLMHILATLDRPTEGNIIFGEQNTAKMKSRALNNLRNRKVGFVFQQFFLNPRQTVLENVALPLKIQGESKRKREQKASHMLEAVDMAEKAKNKAAELSGGQKQRACIARALVTEPEVIFADEPTGNLDSATGELILRILLNLHKKHGITLIIVTHDMDIAKLCQRQFLIKDGKMAEIKK